MKSTFLKWYMVAFILLSGFTVVAQDTVDTSDTVDSPSDDAEDEGTVDSDGIEGTGDSPINSNILYLAGAALAFSFVYYNRKKEVKN